MRRDCRFYRMVIPLSVLLNFCFCGFIYAKEPEAKPVWQLKTKNDMGSFSEVVNRSLIFTRGENYVTVINPQNGQIVWEKSLKDFQEKGFRIIWNDEVYIYSTKKEMVALNLKDGTEKYRFEISKEIDPTSYVDHLVTSNGVLVNYKNAVGFFDLNQGKLLWIRKDKGMTAKDYRFFENGNFLAFYSKSVSMIDYQTGKSIWSRNDEGFRPSDYRRVKNGNFFAFYEKSVRLFDFHTGKDLYVSSEKLNDDLSSSWAWESENPNTPLLFFLKKSTVMIKSSTGEVLWSSSETGNKKRGEAESGKGCVDFVGNAMIVYLEKKIVCVNWETGQEIWTENVKDKDDVADADLYILRDDKNKVTGGLLVITNKLFKIDARSGELSWRNPDGAVPADIPRISDDPSAISALKEGVFFGEIHRVIQIDDQEALIVSYHYTLRKTYGLHLYRLNLTTGKIIWHRHESKADMGFFTATQRKNNYEKSFFGPFIYKEYDAIFIQHGGLKGIGAKPSFIKWISLKDGQELWRIQENLMLAIHFIESAFILDVVKVWEIIKTGGVSVGTNTKPIISGSTIYLQGDEKIFAVDIPTGKVLWQTKINGNVHYDPIYKQNRMILKNGVLYCKTGLFLDENIINKTAVDKPKVVIHEGKFGFIAVDAKTGKVLWKIQNFEPTDPLYLYGFIFSEEEYQTIKNNQCSKKNVDVGKLLYYIPWDNHNILIGMKGIAGTIYDEYYCKGSWRMKGDIKKLTLVENLADGSTVPLMMINEPKKLFFLLDGSLYHYDEKENKILWKFKSKGNVKVSTTHSMIFDISGNKVSAYKF